MTAISRLKVGLALCCFIVVAGCANKEGPSKAATAPVFAISCIAVMPTQPTVEFEDVATQAEKKNLKDGSQIMNGLLKQLLTGKANVKFASDNQSKVMEKEGEVRDLASAQRIAGQLSCNAVLDTTLSRYVERVGGPYGVKDPAAVTFTYRLYEADTGKVLCHGRFDEQQQSVMENLLTISKAQNRGLTWLTAEELLRDGLKERLGQCSYLEGK